MPDPSAPAHFFRCECPTLADLQRSYIELFKYGGVFIKTKDIPPLRDRVAVLLSLPDHSRAMPLGTVAWVNPVHGHRPPGIGIAFSLEHRDLQETIVNLLSTVSQTKSPDRLI